VTFVFRRERARLGAAVVAAAVLLCQATAWVHAATPHVTCLEHGESVHLTGEAAALPVDGPAQAIAPAEATAHEHEHCSLQGQRATSAPAPHPTFARAGLVAIAAPALPFAPPVVGLLRLAPKTSPPRAPVR